jgi:lipopolysaccharide export system permease protein
VKTLDRYIARSFAFNYLIALAVLMSIYIVLDLFFNFDEFTQEGTVPLATTLRAIAEYYGIHLFLYFAQISGVITLFAMAVTLARLQRCSEFVAIVASGVSLYRVALTVILTGVALNALWLLDQEILIPRLAPNLAKTHQDAALNEPYGVWFIRDAGDWLLSAREFDHGAGQLKDLILMRPSEGAAEPDLVSADRATWSAELDGRGGWQLERGRRLTSTYDERGDDTLVQEPIESFYTDLSPDSIALRQSKDWIEFLGRSQLNRIRAQQIASTQMIDRAIHNRFTTPIVNVFILVVGIPLFLSRLPSSVVHSGGRCLLICGACFLFTFFCQNMVTLDYPALSAWLPLIVLTPVMVVSLDQMKT